MQSKASGIEDVYIDIITCAVYYAQSRPEEDGRSSIVSAETTEDIIPHEFDARTKVHEYGGAAAAVRDGVFYFSNWSDQRVYTLDLKGESPTKLRAVTPGMLISIAITDLLIIHLVSEVLRFACFSIHPEYSHLVLATCEDHVDEGWHPWRVRTFLF